jgi:hypothetical protein
MISDGFAAVPAGDCAIEQIDVAMKKATERPRSGRNLGPDISPDAMRSMKTSFAA